MIASGCGRFAFDALDGGGNVGDGTTSDGLAADAAPLGAFGPPMLLSELNAPTDDDVGPSISGDGLELFFCSTRINGYTVWFARRATVTSTWDPPERVVSIDAAGQIECGPDISGDRRELFYGTNQAPAGVWRTERPLPTDPFPATTAIIDSGSNRGDASLYANDLEMIVFNAGTIEQHARASRGAGWGLVMTHPALTGYITPAIRGDGLELFLINGANNLFRTVRASTTAAFPAPTRYTFGTSVDNLAMLDPELSADGRSLYFSADDGGAAAGQLYVATR